MTSETPIADAIAEVPAPRMDGVQGEGEIIETDQELAEEHARDLAEVLAANGYGVEDVTDMIFNVQDPEGHYLYTLTISRTPGY